ncbi:hypothetical protein GF342_00940 [Candidatus Woesearchaeota archaeon]|nr:hypothetical protein [Candidatus Woesearchaeota archaeon]
MVGGTETNEHRAPRPLVIAPHAFGAELAKLRGKRRLDRVSQRTEIAVDTYVAMESGERKPTSEELEALIAAYSHYGHEEQTLNHLREMHASLDDTSYATTESQRKERHTRIKRIVEAIRSINDYTWADLAEPLQINGKTINDRTVQKFLQAEDPQEVSLKNLKTEDVAVALMNTYGFRPTAEEEKRLLTEQAQLEQGRRDVASRIDKAFQDDPSIIERIVHATHCSRNTAHVWRNGERIPNASSYRIIDRVLSEQTTESTEETDEKEPYEPEHDQTETPGYEQIIADALQGKMSCDRFRSVLQLDGVSGRDMERTGCFKRHVVAKYRRGREDLDPEDARKVGIYLSAKNETTTLASRMLDAFDDPPFNERGTLGSPDTTPRRDFEEHAEDDRLLEDTKKIYDSLHPLADHFLSLCSRLGYDGLLQVRAYAKEQFGSPAIMRIVDGLDAALTKSEQGWKNYSGVLGRAQQQEDA